MTQQSESTAQRADAPASFVPLAEPKPLGGARTWPKSFADRLTAPLPGLRAFARFAREGALRPPPEALNEIAALPFEPGPLRRPWTPVPSPSAGRATPVGCCA